MKKNIKAIYLTEIALLILIILFYMLTKVVSSNIKSYLAITFLLIILIINIVLFKIDHTKNYYSGYIRRTIITVLMISGIIIYALGVIIGFTHGYKIIYNSIVFRIIPMILITIIVEYLRAIIVKHSFNNKKSMVFISIILSLIPIILEINYGTLTTSYEKFVFLSTIILPSIAESFLCTYLVHRDNQFYSIMFKLIVQLYMYIIPIVPNLGYYLYAVLKIVVPFIIFYIINKNLLIDENKKSVAKMNRRIFSIPILIASLILVVLVAGIFKYKLIAIATDSMKDTYARGDAVLIEYLKPEEIKVGEVMVFRHSNKVITHRVIDIKNKGNKIYYNTKGDANSSPDGYVTEDKDVIGRVDFVIKYIGYPTVYLEELFGKG